MAGSSNIRALTDQVRSILRAGSRTAKRATDTARRTARGAKDGAKGGTVTPEGVVTIEYTPELDGDPDPGEVVWAWVPFEDDPNQGKDRPVVVIGRRGDSLVGVPLTSRENDREPQVCVGTGAWDRQGRPSYARIWRMLDLDAGSVRREGAVLGRERFDAVVRVIDHHYEVRRSN